MFATSYLHEVPTTIKQFITFQRFMKSFPDYVLLSRLLNSYEFAISVTHDEFKSLKRRSGRVVEGGSLENCCAARYRGFKSYLLRH